MFPRLVEGPIRKTWLCSSVKCPGVNATLNRLCSIPGDLQIDTLRVQLRTYRRVLTIALGKMSLVKCLASH